MTGDSKPSGKGLRGRPSREDASALRSRLCGAALSEFLKNGYAGTSIEGVARASTVSRTTVYALYRDKATLFDEMLRASVVGGDIGARVAFDDRPPQEVLGEAIRLLNSFYYREPNLRLLRLCIAEADRFPDLIERLRDVMSGTFGSLTAYLTRLRDAGQLCIDDCDAATRLFNVLALGSLSPFFVSQNRLPDCLRDSHLDMALNMFLRGVLREP